MPGARRVLEFASTVSYATPLAGHAPRTGPRMALKATKKHKFVKAWMAEHVNDPWVKEAVRLGYRSRAAFKLLELAEKDKLFRPGIAAADLGAAPGSWSQVLRERLGPRARIVAIDILPMEPIPGVTFVQADFRDGRGSGGARSRARRAQAGPCRFGPVPQSIRHRGGGSGTVRASRRTGAGILQRLAATRRRSCRQRVPGRGIRGAPARPARPVSERFTCASPGRRGIGAERSTSSQKA